MKTSETKQSAASLKNNPYQTITDTVSKYKKHVAFVGASAMVAPLFAPIQQVQAEEKARVKQTQTITHTNPFLQSLIQPATTIAKKNDLYASVMLAQAILESGWGQSTLAASPNHNLFGIKGDYKGQSVNVKTLEDNGKQEYYEINDDFRKYPSYSESLEDYAQLIRTGPSWDPMYYSGAWRSNAKTYQDATQALTGRYATDTAYATKLNRVIEANGLAAYDAASSSAEAAPSNPGTYVVKQGDTLYRIATSHGLSVDAIMAMNRLTSSLIQPGMLLSVTTQQSKPSKPVEQPAQKPSVASYTVQPGDTLWSISRKFNTTPAAIKGWNGLVNDVIHPGQVLQTSAKQVSTPSEKPIVTTPSVNAVTVQPGDTLYGIARKLGITVQTLKAVNKLSSDIIQPGQVLVANRTAEAPSKAPAAVAGGSYVVKKGDTLYSIARSFGQTVDQLRAANGLSSELIFVGQELITGSTAKPSTPASTNTYKVQQGDTLYSIAKKNNVSLTQLMELNQINSSLIQPGQTLRVR